MTLTEFLLERIAEDEAQALRRREEWHKNGGVLDLALTLGPNRVLAESDAKRRIVDEHAGDESMRRWVAERSYMDGGECQVCEDGPGRYRGDIEHQPLPCPTLRILAAIYADHPDYREDWQQSPTPDPVLDAVEERLRAALPDVPIYRGNR